MALLSICRKLCFSRPLKIVYSQFHTLRKLDSFPFTKRSSAASFTPKRNFFWIFKKRSKREIIAKDQPPDPYTLIYRNGIDHYFLTLQYGLFFISVTVTLIGVFISDSWGSTSQILPALEEERPQPADNELFYCLSGCIFIVCVFYFIMARMPMRIYYYPQKQKYLMYFYGPIPNQIKKQTVFVGDIQPMPEGLTPWSDTRFQHKSGQKLTLLENYFRQPADLYIMLGWQKDPNVEGYDRVESKQ